MNDPEGQHRESHTQRLRRWLWRYGPAEVAAILASYAGYGIATFFGATLAAAAYAAALTENAGFYSAMGWRALTAAPPGKRMRAIGALFVEFGPAELLDSFVVRPAAVAGAVHLIGPAAGILAGKLVADACFYLLAIITHERLRAREAA